MSLHTLRNIAWLAPLTLLAACAQTTPLSYRTPIMVPAIERPSAETSSWWFRAGAASAAEAITANGITSNNTAPKNIILFLGDGMSLSTITAAHILAGQRLNLDGESYRLSFEKFPYTALSRTYETDQQTPDSAGTMTAIMSGVKTKSGFIGTGQQAKRGDCASAHNQELVSTLELAKAAGLAVGVVTTTTITHATPAATYGHVPDRAWEADANMPEQARLQGCKDIAQQLIEFPLGQGIDVLLGGGRAKFMPKTIQDPEYPDKFGERLDGRNLITEWQRKHPQGAYIWHQAQFNALTSPPDHLLGLFEPSHMRYEHERSQDRAGEPSLAEMTRMAIDLLQRNTQGATNGFFLVIEGGRIDHALHQGNAYRALDETIALANAVQVATELSARDDTLIIVTADHSHTLTLSGYPQRGNPILGLARNSAKDEDSQQTDASLLVDALGLPYTTLGFANGPGYTGASDKQANGSKRYPHQAKNYQMNMQGRPDLNKVETNHPDYLQEAMIAMKNETHGGENVAIFATGAGAHHFHGELEQNVIFHLIAQLNPAIRRTLCKLEVCNIDGIPIDLPSYTKLKQLYAPPTPH